jgi:hypothetical protein
MFSAVFLNLVYLFLHLAAGTKHADCSMWAIMVNLSDHASYHKKVYPVECNVFHFLCLAAYVESSFERKLLKHCFTEMGKLVILLDG